MIWNFGDLLEGCDRVVAPESPALIHGETTVTWAQFAHHSNNLARALLDRGATTGDKVAFYMRNGPAYSELLAACFKARLVHVNVNYRYVARELQYIVENSDARVLVFDAEFAPIVKQLRDALEDVDLIQVGGETPAWATAYQQLIGTGTGEPLDIERSNDDLLFIYTGGTTGMPKAVMWRHEDLWGALGAGANAPANGGQPPATPEQHIANVAAWPAGARQLTACPMMHGTGMLTVISLLAGGGCNITLPGTGLDTEALWSAVQDHEAQSIIIVGDAFARPMLATLDNQPERWNLQSLRVIISSGVMWSREIKLGLLRHLPELLLADMFGSSEAVGFGASVTSAAGEGETARFTIGPDCQVFSEDHRPIEPGSGEPGFIARRGPIPLGYYKDPEKTARTFPTIDGVRYSIPGDWCTVEADGSLTLLGRGSACINSGGEKIYPEEVEEALKTHPDVADALVFGLPDERFGQSVTAVFNVVDGAQAPTDSELQIHLRERLAAYKLPRKMAAAPRVFRAPNGKADYKSAREWVQDAGGHAG